MRKHGRRNTYSFSTLYNGAVALVVLMAAVFIGVFWLISEYRNHDQAMVRMRADYVAIRKFEAKALIDNLVESIEYEKSIVERQLRESLAEYAEAAWQTATSIHAELHTRLPEAAVKQSIIASLMPLRFFEGRGYFWIFDTSHTLVAHPYREKSLGRNDAQLTDLSGQKIVQSFVRTALADEKGGYVEYYWNSPDVDEKYHQELGQKKIAFVKAFKPYGWVIGIGEYVEDSESTLQQKVLERLSKVHSGSKEYIFNHSREGICLNHVRSDLVGTNRWELLDANGMKVVQELDRVGRQPGGGYLEYVGSINPETGSPAMKISFVRSVPDWDWAIGSGVYIADIEEMVQQYRARLLTELRRKLLVTAAVMVVVIVLTFLAGRQVFRGLFREVTLLFPESGEKADSLVDPDQFRIHELKAIATRANLLLEEKQRAQEDLLRAKRLETIGLMAGGVAHDLNNILSGIVGYPELLLSKMAPDSEMRKYVEAIRQSGLRAAAVVADLLTIARNAAKTRELHDLNQLAREYVASPEFDGLTSRYPGIVFIPHFEAVQPCILCSPVHVKQCLVNLVLNAAEAIGTVGEVRIGTRNVTIEKGEADGLEAGLYVVLEVGDNGSGISPVDLEHIFEPFYTKKQMGRSGTGLGLTVVWNTAVDHKGRVFVESSAAGSLFQIYFPGTADMTMRREAADEEALEGHGERILVVDDESLLRDLASQMLIEGGYQVDAVASGEMAVEYVRKKAVDLVVLDMIMQPGMNGRETYQKIDRIHPGQKALILSGYSEQDQLEAILREGVAIFVKKPFSSHTLLKAVKRALRELS